MRKRLYGNGWMYWRFVASGSSGFTMSHATVTLEDGDVVKLCDRHAVTSKQQKHSLPGISPKGICEGCKRAIANITTYWRILP